MELEKYLEGQSMQRPPLFESDGFIYWKNRFETYVKSKDLDLWHVITDGDFPPIQNNPETKKDEIVPFYKQNDDLKKKLAKNIRSLKYGNYFALPRKDLVYEEVIKKDSETIKSKREQSRSIALKAIKESRQTTEERNHFKENKDDKNGKGRKENAFKCGDPNHLSSNRPPHNPISKYQNQKTFVGGSWSDSDKDEEEKTKDEKCLMAKASNENVPKATPTSNLAPSRMAVLKSSLSIRHVQTRRPQNDRGKARHYVSSTSAHHNLGSSSYQGDDDEDDGVSRASTPSPTTYLNSLHPLNYQNHHMPSSSEQTDETLFARQTTLLNQMQ
ncbi:hypothetical protein Tco_0636015 [Tanacetum coccineum]